MKTKFKYINLLFVILILTSCEKFLDVNVDPNNPTTVSPDLVLPTAQKYTADYVTGGGRASHLSNLLMYNWSQSDGFAWYPDEFKYNVTTSFYSGIFTSAYTGALKQYHILDNLDAKYDYYRAIGKIMKAYHFQILVDVYGDVPYSEALLRKDNATPIYDDGATIYASLLVELSAAIELINTTEATIMPGTDDIMFGGDMDSWKAFANSVKLRILVRGKSALTDVQAQVSAIMADGSGFITGDVMINPGYLIEQGKQNPFWSYMGSDEGGTLRLTHNATCASDYIIEYLQNTNDGRIDYIYEEPETGHKGVMQGLLDYDTPIADQYMPDLVSNVGPGLLKSGIMGATIFTMAENYFNQAEAALTLSGFGDAQSLYESGITASFAYLGAPDADLYYSQHISLVGWASTVNKLEAIITQKWIAVNGLTAEQSWFDYSRTGFPRNLPISDLASTNDRPVRLFYPSSEISSNGGNVPSQPDAFSTKIFWAN